jgi:hypothetical protein
MVFQNALEGSATALAIRTFAQRRSSHNALSLRVGMPSGTRGLAYVLRYMIRDRVSPTPCHVRRIAKKSGTEPGQQPHLLVGPSPDGRQTRSPNPRAPVFGVYRIGHWHQHGYHGVDTDGGEPKLVGLFRHRGEAENFIHALEDGATGGHRGEYEVAIYQPSLERQRGQSAQSADEVEADGDGLFSEQGGLRNAA